MPPQRTSDGASARRGRPKGSKNRSSTGSARASKAPPAEVEENEDEDDNASETSNPFASSIEEEEEETNSTAAARSGGRSRGGEEEPEPEKTIPKDLLTRLLHEFFTKDATRISKDSNAAVGKYMDVFVREAIARTAVEKKGGFLEVDDLEKVTPQLLLDL